MRNYLIGTPYVILQSLRSLLLLASEKKYLQLLWNMLSVGTCRMTAYFDDGWDMCIDKEIPTVFLGQVIRPGSYFSYICNNVLILH